MQIVRGLGSVTLDHQPCVVDGGVSDGVALVHSKIIVGAAGVAWADVCRRFTPSSWEYGALPAGALSPWLHTSGRRSVLAKDKVTGQGRGQAHALPTANLPTWPRLLRPGQGIYARVAEHA